LVRRAIDAGVAFLFSRDPTVADYPMGWGNTKPNASWFRPGSPARIRWTASTSSGGVRHASTSSVPVTFSLEGSLADSVSVEDLVWWKA
jgi:hypothetical protein